MFTITAADHDRQGAETDRAVPRSAATREAAQGYMIVQAAHMLQGGDHRVAILDPGYIRLERQDGSGGTTWTIQ